MCTVSYVPTREGFIITSTRDEQINRPTEYPQSYSIKGNDLIFPKDLQSGGTWIALCPGEKRIACLLNGAFENHQRKDTYRLSRGQILLDSFVYPSSETYQAFLDFEDVEPFTLLFIENAKMLKFRELRWDGKQKYFNKIDTTKPQIWSSATLYDSATREQREKLFQNWISSNDWETVADFHANKQGIDSQNDVIMKRDGGLQTLSISQIKYSDLGFTFQYTDLIQNEKYSIYA